jgi:hypothetical protein
MPIVKSPDRQKILVLEKSYAYDDISSGVAAAFADLPVNAVVVGGGVAVTTAWDSATSASLDIGDGVDPNRYTGSVVNMKVVGYTALTLTGFKYAASDELELTHTDTGAPTVGEATIYVFYVVEGRGEEIQGG